MFRFLKSLITLTLFLGFTVSAAEVSEEYIRALLRDVNFLKDRIDKLELKLSPSSNFLKYRKGHLDYLASLRGKASSLEELKGLIDSARLIFHGDEHVNPRSQEFLRFIINSLNTDKESVLFIEWIGKRYQNFVDDFMLSKISEDELKRKIDFNHNWPFSWESYFATLRLAKEKNMKVVLVESQRESLSLRQRDSRIAE